MTEPIRRRSLREAARLGVEAKQQGQAVQPTAPAAPASPSTAKAPTSPPPQRPKPPVVGVEQVVVQCGHVVPFELFELRFDKYRDARRKKLTDVACRDCRLKVAEERTRVEMDEARKRRAERPKKIWTPPAPKSRLPDGARFDVVFNAAKEEWSGTLTVPGLAQHAGSASAVVKLLSMLDGIYRATLPMAAGEE